ncbi:hypothetical protein RJ639_027664 [Escallonia herrerae]|uniref:Alpha/beta hydrolase fold-3 domain-containing protein n=1 Tax=Escallonia herrerae TaxID=1293975 RepID=A0AA88XBX5_9ASTE|nr:hypothetical protein RJ639_027664 [Escallonia herrerae]
MDTSKSEVLHDVPPYIRVYKDGTVERLVGYEVVPATLDPETGVSSKDIVIMPETGVSARLYRPKSTPTGEKLPLVVYFHGGAFCIASSQEPKYHASLNRLVAEANVVLVSVDYRLVPEHPLRAAYEDAWQAIQWVASHASGGGAEACLKEGVDFGRVFLAGDSAGATLAHHTAIRAGKKDQKLGLKLRGMIMIFPYFWGKEPIGLEVTDPFRKAMVDNWWAFVCPSDRGSDDPLINPFADGAPALEGLACNRVIVCVAEKDILRDRGRLYHEKLVKSGWQGKAEMMEIQGEDHVFHIFEPDSEKARDMVKRLATFIKRE